MSYILKLKDRPLLVFDMASEGRDLLLDIKGVAPDAERYLPVDWMCRSAEYPDPLQEELGNWLRHRAIPSNRAYVQSFLSKLGLSEHDVAGIMRVCRGLSLNDSYWIDEEDSGKTFADVNLFDNRFSTVAAYLAFTGMGSRGEPGFTSSPEFTTNGTYAKCWRRDRGTIYLYKEGSVGAANSGGEPYAEYYASDVAQQLGIDAVPYVPTCWKGHFCSKCPCFTSKETAFVSAARLVRTGGFDAVASFYNGRGETFRESFADMLLLDALILNTDRHLGNFGVLVDSESNEIVAPAPLFDHGCSLLFQSMESDYENIDTYVAGQLPCLYTGFLETARKFMGHSQCEKARRALEFEFKRHPRYNWPAWRLRALEKLIRKRAAELLG